jgi:hypothetical protein
MSILYTVDSKTVDEAEFKERIIDTGYYDLPQGERTWTHISAVRQIIMVKTLHGNDGKLHTFRIAIDT